MQTRKSERLSLRERFRLAIVDSGVGELGEGGPSTVQGQFRGGVEDVGYARASSCL